MIPDSPKEPDMTKQVAGLEDVRDDFILHQTECSLEGYGLTNMDPPTEKEARQEFDRWHAAEVRRAKAEALREAAEDLDESTQADINNYIDRPSPTYTHSDRLADVLWLETRADQIEKEITWEQENANLRKVLGTIPSRFKGMTDLRSSYADDDAEVTQWHPGSIIQATNVEVTPSTEEVRTDYIMAYTERQSSQLLAGLAFDRWHAAELQTITAEQVEAVARVLAGQNGNEEALAEDALDAAGFLIEGE